MWSLFLQLTEMFIYWLPTRLNDSFIITRTNKIDPTDRSYLSTDRKSLASILLIIIFTLTHKEIINFGIVKRACEISFHERWRDLLKLFLTMSTARYARAFINLTICLALDAMHLIANRSTIQSHYNFIFSAISFTTPSLINK